jgi:hypothetical protein
MKVRNRGAQFSALFSARYWYRSGSCRVTVFLKLLFQGKTITVIQGRSGRNGRPSS